VQVVTTTNSFLNQCTKKQSYSFAFSSHII
jgi:hypothetical protein